MHKCDIDNQIAALLGVPQNHVKKITGTFIDLVRHALVKNGEVRIPRLGVLCVQEWDGEALINHERIRVHKNRVSFRRSDLLERQLKEKYLGKVRSGREHTNA